MGSGWTLNKAAGAYIYAQKEKGAYMASLNPDLAEHEKHRRLSFL